MYISSKSIYVVKVIKMTMQKFVYLNALTYGTTRKKKFLYDNAKKIS